MDQTEASLGEIITVLENLLRCHRCGVHAHHGSNRAKLSKSGWRRRKLGLTTGMEPGDGCLIASWLQRAWSNISVKSIQERSVWSRGAETFICCLAELIHRAGSNGVKEAVIGMAHRGRLNVLVNLLGKDPVNYLMSLKVGTRAMPHPLVM